MADKDPFDPEYMDALKRKIGGRVRACRLAYNNCTQLEFATDLECSSRHLSEIENGKIFPNVEDITKICALCQVDPNYIIWGIGAPQITAEEKTDFKQIHQDISGMMTRLQSYLEILEKYQSES